MIAEYMVNVIDIHRFYGNMSVYYIDLLKSYMRSCTVLFCVFLENITVIDREESLLEQGPTDDLMCMWNEGLLPRMEWLFLGDFVAPLTHTNRSWDMTLLQCMVWSKDGFQHGGSFRIKGKCVIYTTESEYIKDWYIPFPILS